MEKSQHTGFNKGTTNERDTVKDDIAPKASYPGNYPLTCQW